jgi:hypothetical protein
MAFGFDSLPLALLTLDSDVRFHKYIFWPVLQFYFIVDHAKFLESNFLP